MSATQGTAPALAAGEAPTVSNLWLSLYVAVMVGKFSDWVPGLANVPLAKVAIALTAFSAWRARDSLKPVRIRSLPAARPAIAFLALAIVSIAFSVYKSGSLQQIYGIVVTLFSFVLLIKITQSARDVERLLLALCVGGGGLAIAVLATYSGGRARINLNFDSNDLAYGLVTLLPVMRALAVTVRKRRLLLQGLSIAVVIAIALTGSRGGIIGLSVVVLLLVAYPLRYSEQTGLVKFSLGRFVVALVLIAAVGAITWGFLPGEVRDRISSILDLANDYNAGTSNASRSAIWLRNSAAVFSRPIGYGLGSSEYVDGMTGGAFRAMHNSFVESLVELGLLGLWLFCASYVVALRQLRTVSAAHGGTAESCAAPKAALYARALRIALTGNLVAGFFLSQAYSALLWIVIALCAVLVRVSAPQPVSPPPDSGSR